MKKIAGIALLVLGSGFSGSILTVTSMFGWKGSTFFNMDIPSSVVFVVALVITAAGGYLVMKDKS